MPTAGQQAFSKSEGSRSGVKRTSLAAACVTRTPLVLRVTARISLEPRECASEYFACSPFLSGVLGLRADRWWIVASRHCDDAAAERAASRGADRLGRGRRRGAHSCAYHAIVQGARYLLARSHTLVPGTRSVLATAPALSAGPTVWVFDVDGSFHLRLVTISRFSFTPQAPVRSYNSSCQVRACCPCLTELDLANNLLPDWQTVGSIVARPAARRSRRSGFRLTGCNSRSVAPSCHPIRRPLSPEPISTPSRRMCAHVDPCGTMSTHIGPCLALSSHIGPRPLSAHVCRIERKRFCVDCLGGPVFD